MKEDVVKNIRNYLNLRRVVSRYFFGSYSAGQVSSRSDIDIANIQALYSMWL